MRFFQLVLILLLACSINSCTLVKTAYNNAPQALSWWLDNYFDFTSAQKSVLSPALRRLHDWHRQNQLPADIATLQDLHTMMGQAQFTAESVCEKIDQISTGFSQIQTESIPIIIEIAPLLNNKQLQYFRRKLDDRAIEWKSDWWQDSAEAQLSVRLEKMQDFSEKIYGRLNAQQQAILRQQLSLIAFQPALSYAEILRRHDDAEQIISTLNQSSLSADAKARLVQEGFDRLKNSPNIAYQEYANLHKQNICQTIANLHASTDSKQKQHAKDWLHNYIVQFSQLTQTKPSP